MCCPVCLGFAEGQDLCFKIMVMIVTDLKVDFSVLRVMNLKLISVVCADME